MQLIGIQFSERYFSILYNMLVPGSMITLQK